LAVISPAPVIVDSSPIEGPAYLRSCMGKEGRMLTTETNDRPIPQEQLKGTLWHCSKCDAFISIHCLRLPQDPLCPTCFNTELDFCGGFDSFLGRQFADA